MDVDFTQIDLREANWYVPEISAAEQEVFRPEDQKPARRALVDVVVGPARCIGLRWESGLFETTDLSPVLVGRRRYKRLLNNDVLFRTARVGGEGAYVEWGDGTLVEAIVLATLHEYQMASDEFRGAMSLLDLGYEAMAAQLGVSKRMIGSYRAGKRIPRSVSLAVRMLLHIHRAKHSSRM